MNIFWFWTVVRVRQKKTFDEIAFWFWEIATFHKNKHFIKQTFDQLIEDKSQIIKNSSHRCNKIPKINNVKSACGDCY